MFFLCAAAILGVTGVFAGNEGDASRIIATERSAMQRWAKGDPDGFLQILDQEITFFDPSLTARADGIGLVGRLYEDERGKVDVEIELMNPRVQIEGSCAVLTFNLVTRDRTPERRERRWHATEVFRKANGEWRIIHGHYSLAKVG
jgi:ketosteroid isomerase-like protein